MISTRLGLDASFFSSVRFLIAKAIPGPSAIRYPLGVRPVIPFLTQGTPHPRGVFGWNLQLFCTVVFGWFLLILKQFDMKNVQNEFQAGFRAWLNQTGTKLTWNWECTQSPPSNQYFACLKRTWSRLRPRSVVATIPHHPPFDPLASVPKILSTDLSLLAPPLAVQKHPRFVGCFCTALMREGTSCVDFFARLFLDGSCLSSSNLTWKMYKTNSKLGFVPDWIRQARN